MSGRLRMCERNLSVARRRLEAARRAVFAKGRRVSYAHGDHSRTGVVVDCDVFCERLLLKSPSGKSVWVGAWRCVAIAKEAGK